MLLYVMMSIKVVLSATIPPKLPFSLFLFLKIISSILAILALASLGAMATLAFPEGELD